MKPRRPWTHFGHRLQLWVFRLESFVSILYITTLTCLCAPSQSAEGLYAPSTKNRRDFQAAIELVNYVLAANGSLRLVEIKDGTRTFNTNEIPVQLVRFPSFDKGKVALVPPFRKAIMVDGRELEEVQKLFSSPFHGAKQIDRKLLLGLFLLHECGHIVNFDYLKDPPPVKQTQYQLNPMLTNSARLLPSPYNLDQTPYKNMEETADEFVAEHIRKAGASTNKVDWWSPAVSLSMAAAEASMNAQHRRLKQHFGAYELGDPSVLADPDLGHPNLELRLLRINYYINRSLNAKMLLDDFMQARTNVHFLPKTIYMNIKPSSQNGELTNSFNPAETKSLIW